MSATNQTKPKKLLFAAFISALALITIFPAVGSAYAADPKHYDLLIIGPSSYEHLMENFVDFKLTQQVAAQYVSTETLALSQAQQPTKRLHDFVANEISQSSIKYLLLVGNYEQVPTRYVYSPSEENGLADFNYKPTDWYYSVSDWKDSAIGFLGGNVPQIAVGRLPVNNQQELEQTLTKIMAAEKSSASGSLVTLHEPSLKLNPALTIPSSSFTLSIDQTTSQLDELVFGSAGYVASYTHGTASALWTKPEGQGWNPLFTSLDAANLNSDFKIFYVVACFTGALDLNEESLARTLITSPHGPALVIASSRTEGSDNCIASTFWERFFATGNIGESFTQALRNYLNDPEVFSSEKQAFQRYNFYLDKVIYGDPSWHIETAQPTQLSSSVPQAETEFLLSGNQKNFLAESNSMGAGGSFLGPSALWSLFAFSLLIRRFAFAKPRQLSGMHVGDN